MGEPLEARTVRAGPIREQAPGARASMPGGDHGQGITCESRGDNTTASGEPSYYKHSKMLPGWLLQYLMVLLVPLLPSVSCIHHGLNMTLLDAVTMAPRFRRTINHEVSDRTYDVPTRSLLPDYDFIIVGAGTAGATLANRLTEIGEWRVLLLEAGGEEKWVVDIPMIHAHMQLTDYNWGYRAQRQEGACLGLDLQRCRFHQGKGVGGTSLINAMLYTRGHARDYDAWESLGNPGWGWKDALKYFKKSEAAKGEFATPEFHGYGGYLSVETSPFRSPLLGAWLDSAQEVGHSITDYNNGGQIGFAVMQATIRDGTRCSSNKAFLRPIRKRSNLHVAKHAQVTKVLIHPKTRKAEGVQFYRNGKFWTVRARKEVILSSGAFNTPQLLMLSGIGPREHLEEVGIFVVKDSPGVGQNLQDHVAMSGLAFNTNQSGIAIVENRLVFDLPAALDYFINHRGKLTSLGGIEGIAYVRTPVATTPPDYPDVELIFASGSIASDDGRVIRKGIGITDEIMNSVFKPLYDRDTWTVWPMITRQESKGWVKLKSKNPFSWPVIYANYFDDPQDMRSMVEGIKFAVEISKTKAFQKYGSRLHDIPLPGCKQHQFGSDEYWECTARQLTSSLHHFCGTAKMGPSTDPMAVVDPELRVYGVQGLRVVDASIMPIIPAGHTNGPTFMVAEKAADMIKQEWLQRENQYSPQYSWQS